jgi:hypothetical protein
MTFALGSALLAGAAAAVPPAQADGTTERVSVGPSARQANGANLFPSISTNGRFVAFLSQATNLVPTT